MIVSLKNKYLYIAVPKTGTTSIQNFLLDQDSTASKNGIEIKGVRYPLGEHYTAAQAKHVLQDHYKDFITFGFIRNPFSRLVSSYYFYKQGGKSFDINPTQRSFITKIKYLSAKILPFKIWAVIYPYKSNIEFFQDRNNKTIVDYIGTFENLNSDLRKILKEINLDFRIAELEYMNKTKHFPTDKYFNSKWFIRILKFRHRSFRDDLVFYNRFSSVDKVID